ncbi:hypothetical protein FH972_011094 [Carpinus fangiana]|uniref:Uncharacterized protein n=1 Tax=Carpinus fangiana TaxID=176857 RepID=A0A660KS99_9ROSI|nr:hypothetical protein FH972_011094 [Carpinus fangiana]
MEVNDALGAAVLFKYLEGSNNYVDWSIQVQNYLVAKDLWDTIEATAKPPKQEDDEAAFKAWSDKNSMALRVIENSCQPNTFSEIGEISFAKVAWNTLAKKYLPKVVPQLIDKDNYVEWSDQVKNHLMAHDLWDIVEGTTYSFYQEDEYASVHALRNSMALHVLEEYNYVDWSVQVKNYLMAHDLWDIIEETPPRQKDNEVAFKAWSKNCTALHVIRISCGTDAFSRIKKISTAKIAWNALAEWNRIHVDREAFQKVAQNWNQINVDDHEAFKEEFKEVVRRGDSNSVEEFMNRHPGSAGLKITYSGDTVLHVAVDAGHGNIVEMLVAIMSEQELEITNNEGNTALINAIRKENYRMAECMLRKNKNLVSIKSSRFGLPVLEAFKMVHEKLFCYLYSLTPAEDLKPENGWSGATLCYLAICIQNLDFALDLIEQCPSLALATDQYNRSPFYELVSSPFAFPSENRMVFWKRWIYKC